MILPEKTADISRRQHWFSQASGKRGHRLPTIKHFSVSLSFLKSKGEEKPLSILPAGYSEDISGLMEVS